MPSLQTVSILYHADTLGQAVSGRGTCKTDLSSTQGNIPEQITFQKRAIITSRETCWLKCLIKKYLIINTFEFKSEVRFIDWCSRRTWKYSNQVQFFIEIVRNLRYVGACPYLSNWISFAYIMLSIWKCVACSLHTRVGWYLLLSCCHHLALSTITPSGYNHHDSFSSL